MHLRASVLFKPHLKGEIHFKYVSCIWVIWDNRVVGGKCFNAALQCSMTDKILGLNVAEVGLCFNMRLRSGALGIPWSGMHDSSPDSASCHRLSAARQGTTLCPYFFILYKGQSDLLTQGFSSSEGGMFYMQASR